MVFETNIALIVVAGSLLVFVLILAIITFTAIYNKRLVEKDNEMKMAIKNKELQMLRKVIETQEAEREKLALNLHDEVGPLLSSYKLKLSKNKRDFDNGKFEVSRFVEDKEFMDLVIASVRKVSHELSPQYIMKFGLVKALDTFITNIEGIDFTFEHDIGNEDEISRYITGNMYCILMELLNNIIKYEDSGWIRLSLQKKSNILEATITHGGIGLTQEEFNSFEEKSQGLGLTSIKSRILILNARLVFTRENNSASIKIITPLINEE